MCESGSTATSTLRRVTLPPDRDAPSGPHRTPVSGPRPGPDAGPDAGSGQGAEPSVAARAAGASADSTPGVVGEGEEVDAVPVLAAEPALPARVRGPRALARERVASGALPAVQAAAVAAGSFVAGAAVAGLVHRRHSRSPALGQAGRVGRTLARGSRKAARAPERLQIVGSRTLLVDVHLLGMPDGER